MKLVMMKIFLNDVLLVRDIVESRTTRFDVFAIASAAREDLKFIRNAFHLVSQGTEELVIHIRFTEYLCEFIIA